MTVSKQLNDLSSEEKRQLLAQLLREKTETKSSFYPLSHVQHALWFIYQTTPANAAYNVALAVRIRSEVDVAALQHAFQILVGRHPALRTTFSVGADGEPMQEIHTHKDLCFTQTDASGETWEQVKQQVVNAYQEPFDLERGPLFRVNLFTRDKRDHVLLLSQHHIVTDFWSLLVLMDEIRTLYPAECAGASTALPPLKHSYNDFVRWQCDMLTGDSGQKLWEYWQQQLSGELPVLNLPTDYPHSSIQTQRGSSYFFQLPEELTQQLKNLAQTEGTTLYMLLLAALQLLLHRYSGQDDLVVGSPMSGRTDPRFANIVGYFVNLVALRANFSGNPPFTTFLKHIRRTVLEALEHQEYPFPLLVKQLNIQRNPGQSPLVQTLFTLQKPQQFKEITQLLIDKQGGERIEWGGLDLEPFELNQQEGQFDISVEMIETADTLAGVFKYNINLFKQETIARMSSHFTTLLEGIVTAPKKKVSEFSLLTDREQQQLLVEWNATVSDYPVDRCIHELFEAQVEQTPDAVALIFEDTHITYRELNNRANQLAHHLRSTGVTQEVLVGICIERSIELIIALLGILKAGGVYVPLDISYPPERLRFMLEDTQIQVLLTQQQLASQLPISHAQIICLDTDWETIALQKNSNPNNLNAPGNLAYLMYTSGSTGRPKGTSIPHRAVVRLVKNTNYAVLNADEVFLQFASISFDASTLEIWGSLLNGSRLVIMSPDHQSLEQLGQAIQKYQITTLWLTAGLFHLMVDQRLDDLQGLHQLLAGGDVLSPPHVRKVLDKLDGCTLINGYGPTENTTFTCCYTIPKSYDMMSSVPIGSPIANTQVYILDSDLNLVPIGIPGELYIGGDGLARGYFNRPELTQEKFIQSPFSESPEKRLYKTGDLARYLPDGNIEFLGRIDDQVKIRGFRVELGEIEAVLAKHPAVEQTVVLAWEDSPSDKSLVAYFIKAKGEGQKVKSTELREYLTEKLPDYMIPSVFVTLEAFPLNSNGKVDRRALPAPERSRNHLEQDYIAPRTPNEQTIADIWADVLGVEQVGIYDNFFEIGGHSLLATQIISRIRQEFYIDLPLRHLLEEPTIANLSESLETILWMSQQSPAESGQNREEIEL